jgi:hypothetical protein
MSAAESLASPWLPEALAGLAELSSTQAFSSDLDPARVELQDVCFWAFGGGRCGSFLRFRA